MFFSVYFFTHAGFSWQKSQRTSFIAAAKTFQLDQPIGGTAPSPLSYKRDFDVQEWYSHKYHSQNPWNQTQNRFKCNHNGIPSMKASVREPVQGLRQSPGREAGTTKASDIVTLSWLKWALGISRFRKFQQMIWNKVCMAITEQRVRFSRELNLDPLELCRYYM